ncbi:MAG: CotH kinase family protein, partial [Bacteroidota bacterium]
MFLFVFMVFFKTVEAQEIRINEAVSSNSVFVDENGETPDWFELHNYGSTAISLNNWSITDDSADLKKWVFPNIIIEPDEYLMIWASGNDYRELKYARTLIDRGDECKYIIPSSELPTDWSSNGFNDTSWDTGNTGLGYGDNDDQTIVPAGTRSVFVRSHFFVSNPADLAELILDIDYDDGFVAYINGVEIARANINGTPPAFNSGTFQDHEALIYGGGKPDRFIVNEPANIIVTGENVLSIQLHNVSENSSDMTLIPFLSGIYASPSNDGVTPPPILNLGNTHLHTNFKISSAGETLTLSDEVGNIVDVLTVEGLVSDMSIGVSSTSGNITYYTSPTPGEVNDSQEYLGAITKEVLFSHQGGIVDGAIALTLSGNTANEIIRYTTDKTEPNETSPIYSGAINISSIAVIRARMFKDNYIPSYTYSKAYIFNTTTALPVVSLVTDPYNLFDNDYGIYELGDSYDENMPHWGANFWEDWERPIQFSLYETDGSLGTEFNGGVKIFGGWSRANAQRSLSIFARGSYGVSEIDYKFFEELNYDKFQAVVLRNSGNDWLKTNIRDAALTSLMEGADIEFQAHRSTATYINGEYWGIYNLREKVNEHFLASKHNIDADDIDLLERNGEVIEGSNLEYNSLIEYITTTDLTSDVNFEYIENNVDVDNFILYEVAQIYFNNTDWPGNNIKFWKHPEGKWRWILYDTDFGFGIWNQYDYNHDALSFAMEPNGPGWPNPPWSTLMLRRLMTNISFRNRFINRFADELNSRFLFDNVSTHIQDVSDVISSEIP